MTATEKFNRVGSSILAVVIVALNLATVSNLYADTPDKRLYDHSRIKNINANDMRYIMDRIAVYDSWNNITLSGYPSVRWLFFDNLQVIDKGSAEILASGGTNVRYVFLGVPSIDDDVLEILTAVKAGKEFLEEKENPILDELVFNRLNELSESQARILMKWRGDVLIVPDTVKITPEVQSLIRDNFRSWEFKRLSKSEIATYRKIITDHYEGK